MKKLKKIQLFLSLLPVGIGLLLSPAGVAQAQGDELSKNKVKQDIKQTSLLDSLLKYDEVVEVRLAADWSRLDTQRYVDEYLEGNIRFKQPDGKWWDLEVEVKPRGKFRRKICDSPPVKLNFSKKELRSHGLEGKFDKFKLVSNCLRDQDWEAGGEKLVLREYLAYKLYQLVEPEKSFRVKLLKIRYEDTGRRRRWTDYAFLIEEEDELAERQAAEECECMNAISSRLIRQQEARVALFQFMIANADWGFQGMRNLKLFNQERGDSLLQFAVPYDFDFSGLVNAPYAVPAADIGQRSIRHRLYLGQAVEDQPFWEGLRPFLTREDEILQMVEDFRLLPREDREDMKYFLETFFSEIRTVLREERSNFFSHLPHPRVKDRLATPAGRAASPKAEKEE